MKDNFDMTLLPQVIRESVEQTIREDVWPKLKKIIQEEFNNVSTFPKNWIQQVFTGLEVGNVTIQQDGQVQFQVVTKQLDKWQMIKAKVIDKGNQENGKLWTEPNRTSLNEQITGEEKKHGKLGGQDVVWVFNTNYPGGKRKVTVKKKNEDGEQVQVQREKKARKFWPIFSKTYLPQQFNKQGQGKHAMENAIARAKTDMCAIFETGVNKRVFDRTGITLL